MTKNERWLLEEKYTGEQTPEFKADCARLEAGEPLAYVIGYQPFLGLKVYLNSYPLIPRPETEWWTEQLITYLKGDRAHPVLERPERDGARQSKFSAENYAAPKQGGLESLTILDLCAGSGAIGCAILKNIPDSEVYFGEIDPAHEQTILKNIRENDLDESRAHVHIADLFDPFENMRFDVIAANPPYIPSGRELPKSVAHFEPAQALFSGNDGLEIIRRIAAELKNHLAPRGQAWIECDASHIETAAKLFKGHGFNTQIVNDQYGRPRVLVVS